MELRDTVQGLVERAFGEGVRVAALDPLAGDASTRRYARARLAGERAPATAVVMILADRGVAMSSDELADFQTDELPYLNVHRLFVEIGMPVPEVYLDAADQGFLLLEDIGDTTLWEAAQVADPEPWFAEAIEVLVKLQRHGTAKRREDCIAFQQSFDRRLFLWEFEHFIQYGMQKRSADLTATDIDTLWAFFTPIAERLDREPRVLNHRDYHAWNLFVHEGRIRVIDFQDALLAPAPYDLATLLGDRVTPSLIRPAVEDRLLAHYATVWEREGGAPWDLERLQSVYFDCALQKAFKVVGRFHYLDIEKGKTTYLRYLPPTLAQIRRLLEARSDAGPVQEVLGRFFPELA